jgi:hypothetical protein
MKICSKKYNHGPKSLTIEIPEYLWLLHTPKKLRYGHLLRPGSRSDQKGPDPTGSGTLLCSGSLKLLKNTIICKRILKNVNLLTAGVDEKVCNLTHDVGA